ncbi:MAG: putative ABC transporter permease [Gorillibacterium sp.]|nr:putative ABC transporter permease [Gorillibacterium sp.]
MQKGWINMNFNSVAEIVFYFAVYSFVGFLLENTLSLVLTGVFWKDGFLRSPHKPMYGIAPVILLYAAHELPLGITLLLCFIVPTAVELLSGIMLDKGLQRRYWDYSKLPLQYRGYICLPFSLVWLGLSALVLYGMHPSVAAIYRYLTPVWVAITPYFLLYLLVDTCLAIWKQDRVALPER